MESAVEPEHREIHRIGGSAVENLRLKPREAALDLPGISVLKCDSAREAAQSIRRVFPKAADLLAACNTVGSTTEDLIRSAGFDMIHDPTRSFPNHYRIIHPDGVEGFNDENLAQLSLVFVTTTGH